MTAAQLVARLEPVGSVAAECIEYADGVADVVPVAFIECPTPRGYEIVEPCGYGLELVNRLWGPEGPRS